MIFQTVTATTEIEKCEVWSDMWKLRAPEELVTQMKPIAFEKPSPKLNLVNITTTDVDTLTLATQQHLIIPRTLQPRRKLKPTLKKGKKNNKPLGQVHDKSSCSDYTYEVHPHLINGT